MECLVYGQLEFDPGLLNDLIPAPRHQVHHTHSRHADAY